MWKGRKTIESVKEKYNVLVSEYKVHVGAELKLTLL